MRHRIIFIQLMLIGQSSKIEPGRTGKIDQFVGLFLLIQKSCLRFTPLLCVTAKLHIVFFPGHRNDLKEF